MKSKSNSPTATLPYPLYYIPILILTLAGIGDTIYLAYSHYQNYTDISYASFCAISKAINCDTVSQSPWSILFNIPVAIWGLIGYLLFLIFLVPTRKNNEEERPLWSILFSLAALYSLSAIFFGYISAEKIHSYCLLCLFSYAISFALLLYSWIIRRRFSQTSLLRDLKRSLSLIWQNNFIRYSLTTLLVITICLRLFLPHYWQYRFPVPELSAATGITDKGHPWIGATNPTLTIEEFTDYQCFQCAKMHHFLRRLVTENPETIRLVHHNYPMDNEVNPHVVPEPFHVGSGRLALLAIASIKQNKFWQVNDEIFRVAREKKSTINIQEIAESANADAEALIKTMYTKKSIRNLEEDIRTGLRHNITGTPAYIIDDELYIGTLPKTIFKDINKLK